MSRTSVRRAALGLLVAVLLGIAVPAPASAWSEDSSAGVLSVIWEWIQGLWPEEPDSVQPACTEDCGEAGYGVDPNG